HRDGRDADAARAHAYRCREAGDAERGSPGAQDSGADRGTDIRCHAQGARGDPRVARHPRRCLMIGDWNPLEEAKAPPESVRVFGVELRWAIAFACVLPRKRTSWTWHSPARLLSSKPSSRTSKTRFSSRW